MLPVLEAISDCKCLEPYYKSLFILNEYKIINKN